MMPASEGGGTDNIVSEPPHTAPDATPLPTVSAEENYRALFGAIDVGFCLIEMRFDEQGKSIDYQFLDANSAFERHTGLLNAIGRTARELVPNLDEFWFRTYGDVALTGKPTRFESHAPAMSRWFDVYAVRVGTSSSHRVALLFTDITERKEAQEAVRLSEAQLRDAQNRLGAALSAGNIATWTYDISGNRLVADTNLARLFSVSAEAAAGGKLEEYLKAIHPEDRERVTNAILEATVSKNDYEAEYRVVLPDGTNRWLVARGRVERNEEGVAVALPGVVIDITERVEREQREQFLADFTLRTQTLTDADAIIADAVQSLGDFLQVSRCLFYDVDLNADTVSVRAQYRADDSVGDITGVLPMSSFGPFIAAELKAGRAFTVDDVRQGANRVPPGYAATYEVIGIRAFAIAPAVYSDRLISGITVQCDTPRHWLPEEVSLLQSVADRTWLMVEVIRKQNALNEEAEKRRRAAEGERRRLAEIFMRAPAFMTALRGPEHRYELANLPYYQLIGKQDAFPTQGIIGKTVAEVIPEVVEQGFITLLDQVYQTGEAFIGTDMRVALQADRDAPLSEHFVDFTFQPTHAEDGSVSGILVHGIDLTERKRLEQERERLLEEQHVLLADARARAAHEALLNQISEAVREAEEPDAILPTVVKILGMGLDADRCYFVRYDLMRDTASVTPEWLRSETQQSLVGRSLKMSSYLVDRNPAYKAGRTHVVDDVDAFAPEEAAPLLELGIRALLRVPIEVGNEMTALAVAMADAPRQWSRDEIRLVENVAALTRSAWKAAITQQRERNIAVQLQDALQPPKPENLPGLALASYYRPALAEASVGGDFFDVFAVENGCTALVVADLSGKGLAAASQIATVRNMLRYAVYSSTTVAEAVSGLHEALVKHDLLTGFATLFIGIYDETKKNLTYVNCGQEPGLIYRAESGTVEWLADTGPVLGGFGTSGHEQMSVNLEDGDVLALFTDGLTEVGPSRKMQLEVDGVSALLSDCCKGSATTVTSPTAIVECLISAIDAYARGGMRDDIALLVGVVGGGK